MNRILCAAALGVLATGLARPACALDRPDITFKIFQFPADKIPQIDGKADDWAIVPDSYAIGGDQLVDDSKKFDKMDPADLDVKVKVAWVKGENRLYFLYEAYDNYWDFEQAGLHNDTFEIVVDGDCSGGNLIARNHPDKSISEWEAWFKMQGVHAQNYHIFTPAVGKDWCMAWGPQAPWIKKMPWSNCAYGYSFKQGEKGKLTMEFWITPFDLASPEGPEKSVPSKLEENKTLGLSWAIMDYEGPQSERHTFWNLSRKHTMYGNASELCAFKLMPLEEALRPKLAVDWSFKLVDEGKRAIAFHDETVGRVTSWKWSFGDGQTSTEQHPRHEYAKPGNYVVVLEVDGPDGKGRRSKVWDVTLK